MSESCDWYFDWAMNHAVAFGLGEQGLKTIYAWESAFTKLFGADELHDATAELLGQTDLKPFASDHRGAIIGAVETARSRRRLRKEVPNEDRSCKLCKGNGWAIVPHPGIDGNGCMIGYLKSPRNDARSVSRDLAVCCTCDIGERTRAGMEERVRETGKRPPLTLAVYADRYPDWQAERDAIKEAEFRGESGIADWDRIKRELANRMRMPARRH